jgi:uncharacterized protein
MKLAIIVVAATLTVAEAVAQPATTQVDGGGPHNASATGALFKSIRASDMMSVKTALAAGANVNGRSDEGDTPLMYAAVYSTADCVKTLLEHGADPNQRDKRGGTALMRAVRDLDKVRLLIERGAEVDARSVRGVTALMTAANQPGTSKVVRLLLENKADPRTPDAAGVPPLMYATNLGDLDTVEVLVAAGAEIDAGRDNGANPLFWASSGAAEVVVWLLEHQANPNGTRTSTDRRTPLMEAALFGSTANARALLDWGADVNATSDRGTALIWAAGSDLAAPELIRLLLDRGADPNAVASRCERCIHEPRSEDGRPGLTALMLARQRGETEIVKMLLAAGATR